MDRKCPRSLIPGQDRARLVRALPLKRPQSWSEMVRNSELLVTLMSMFIKRNNDGRLLRLVTTDSPTRTRSPESGTAGVCRTAAFNYYGACRLGFTVEYSSVARFKCDGTHRRGSLLEPELRLPPACDPDPHCPSLRLPVPSAA